MHMTLRRTPIGVVLAFTTPALIGLLVFRLGPIVAAAVISLTDWQIFGAGRIVGLRNYIRLFGSSEFRYILGNTLVFALLYVPGVMVIGVTLASLLNSGLRASAFFRGLYFMPYITVAVAVTLTWRWIFSTKFGLLNNALLALGVADPPAWLGEPTLALLSVAVVSVWRDAGFYMLLLLAGLQTIDPGYREAALVDGARRLQIFRYVTLPLLTPTLFFVSVIALVRSTQTFEITYSLTNGGPNRASTTLAYYIFQNAFIHFEMGRAAALAFILCLLVGVITLINFRFRRRWVHD